MGSEIDWAAFREAVNTPRFIEMLMKLPEECWSKQNVSGYTLLHYACRGNHVQAVKVLSKYADVNTPTDHGLAPMHYAAMFCRTQIAELLYIHGADLQIRDKTSYSPLEIALLYRDCENGDGIVHMFLANGVRLSTVQETFQSLITIEMTDFENSVLRCRKAVIAMIRVRKAAQLWHVDRFLLREIGFAIWATRYDWSKI